MNQSIGVGEINLMLFSANRNKKMIATALYIRATPLIRMRHCVSAIWDGVSS
jgi:hypothetical protein